MASSHALRAGLAVAIVGVLLTALVPAWAADYTIGGRQSATVFLPGAFACLYNPATGAILTDNDPYGVGIGSSFAVLLDTGASGIMLSKSVADSLSVPTTSETYTDVGISGTEVFKVSQPLGLRLAVASWDIYHEGEDPFDLDSWVDNTENQAFYSSYGTFVMQVRQEDSNYGGYPVAYNVVGTPVLNSYVMHVKPNTYSYSTMIPTLAYLETELLASMPNDLPSTGVLRIPLDYQNFVTTQTSVTTADNPMVPGVQVMRDGHYSASGEWLFDTGASLTMMGTDMASQIGINWQTEDPVSIVTVSGVGAGSPSVILSGYRVDELIIPTLDGKLTFTDVIVYISTDGSLPADLTGILGMNLFSQSIDADDQFSIYYPTESAFTDWYVDPFSSQLVLVTEASAVPEPSGIVLLAACGAFFGLRRAVRRGR